MSSERAETELGWTPKIDALTALKELFAGMAGGEHTPSPPLSAASRQPGRPTGLLAGRPPGQGNPY
ncbi:hypothetical protein [Micromonospora sp. NPDC049359]